ncbi:hypothetical protein PAEPH01_2676 [Pancytospora epiphaga]|nr:hypothetical protein PAEPH01_2676 [Pancytospora epiphaga]
MWAFVHEQLRLKKRNNDPMLEEMMQKTESALKSLIPTDSDFGLVVRPDFRQKKKTAREIMHCTTSLKVQLIEYRPNKI